MNFLRFRDTQDNSQPLNLKASFHSIWASQLEDMSVSRIHAYKDIEFDRDADKTFKRSWVI